MMATMILATSLDVKGMVNSVENSEAQENRLLCTSCCRAVGERAMYKRWCRKRKTRFLVGNKLKAVEAQNEEGDGNGKKVSAKSCTIYCQSSWRFPCIPAKEKEEKLGSMLRHRQVKPQKHEERQAAGSLALAWLLHCIAIALHYGNMSWQPRLR